ncbi:USP6 N-terminal-like protein [Ochotona princeps]|uniref:USP6 N-terminal-like protein n=1 Tax=Ochotona princeps TaxID=9978 RepID=UPI0027147671|nr:USP6 N-terminal-like protein [Ochotona princeps]
MADVGTQPLTLGQFIPSQNSSLTAVQRGLPHPQDMGLMTALEPQGHEKSLSCDNTLGTKQRRTESRRLGKWVKMLKNYSKYCSSEKFHRRFFKDIPSQVRGKVWMLMLDVDTKKARNPGKFKELKDQARRQSGEVYHIDSAVRGTFRDHLMFREQYGTKQQDLFGVLMAYSMYNPEVGYGQGLSHIAAMLLMWLNEEDAFWALVQLMENEKYSMSGLYKPGLPKLEMLQNHLGDLVHRTLPALEQHLEKQGGGLDDYTARWFTQCFLDAVPFSLALRIWDIFLLEGQHVLTTMAHVALKLHHKRLLKMSQGRIQEFLQVTLKQAWALDDNAVIKQLQSSKHELSKLQCLMPPEGKSYSMEHELVYISQKPIPATTTPQGGETAQELGPLCQQQPEPSASLAGLPPMEPMTFCLVWGIDEEENSAKENSSESLGQGALVRASGCAYVANPAKTPCSVWDKGRQLQWHSLPNLCMPIQGEDSPPPELGSQEGFRAHSLPFLEPLGSESVKSIPAPGRGMKMAPWNYFHGCLLEYGDIGRLEPPRASVMMSEQPNPRPTRGLFSASSLWSL